MAYSMLLFIDSHSVHLCDFMLTASVSHCRCTLIVGQAYIGERYEC